MTSQLLGGGAPTGQSPPSVPHAFITESDSDGHVLTVHEDLIWLPLKFFYPGTRETFGLPGDFVCRWQINRRAGGAGPLLAADPAGVGGPVARAREHTGALAQAVLPQLLRNARLDDHAASGMRGELKLFQRLTR